MVAHMAWWHDHSVLAIESLRSGRQPYDRDDPTNATDARNERTYGEHSDDPPELRRQAFEESFVRLLAALEPITDEELFAERSLFRGRGRHGHRGRSATRSNEAIRLTWSRSTYDRNGCIKALARGSFTRSQN